MILGRNVEQDETMCRVQELYKHWLFYFWSYIVFPFDLFEIDLVSAL